MEPGDEKDDQINIQLLDNWELNVNKVVLWTRIFALIAQRYTLQPCKLCILYCNFHSKNKKREVLNPLVYQSHFIKIVCLL